MYQPYCCDSDTPEDSDNEINEEFDEESDEEDDGDDEYIEEYSNNDIAGYYRVPSEAEEVESSSDDPLDNDRRKVNFASSEEVEEDGEDDKPSFKSVKKMPRVTPLVSQPSENDVSNAYNVMMEETEVSDDETSLTDLGGYKQITDLDSSEDSDPYPAYGSTRSLKKSLMSSTSSNSEISTPRKPQKPKGKPLKKIARENKRVLALSRESEGSGSGSESSNQQSPVDATINTNNCYWNTEFQRALDMNEGREQWTKLAKLAHDFVYCSKTYGKIIISEYYLPENEKTIKSIDAGGLAGGSKYICSNIFFKFALDTDLTEDTRKKKGLTEEQLPPMWMYGGPECDDYSAMKASKNDMTGLMSYYNAQVPGLYFPLMALIDYRGFRLIAMSILPISRSSIRYGSADGGKTIHKINEELNKKMQDAGELLNLKGHRTGQGRVMVWGPGDIEGHEGTDGKYYVVDFGRTFPPEAPSESGSRKIFYCLLRPEFVRMYPKPLSSDAFSCWGKCNSKIHNLEVREATEYLYNTIIPRLAKELQQKKMSVTDIRLTETLHSSGINCRHLGKLRKALSEESDDLLNLLMTEMVARLLSGLLRQLLRLEMKRTKVASQEPYKTVVIDFLNIILNPSEQSMDSGVSFEEQAPEPTKILQLVEDCSYLNRKRFWTRDVKEWIETKFVDALLTKERAHTYNLRESLNLNLLLTRLCEQSGIKLSKHAMAEYIRHPAGFQVLNFDLRKVSARVKHLNVIDEAEGNLLFLEARNHSHREGLWEATNEKFARAVCSNTNNPSTFVRWGSILLKQCNHFRSKSNTLQMAEKLLDEAEEKFQSALKLNPKMHEAKYELANTFVFKGVLIHLYKPEDTIAIALWNLEEASRHYYSAFHTNSHYFQKLLMQVDELAEQAENPKLSSTPEVRAELFLRGFFMLHCAIAVAPRCPESSTFLQAGLLLKQYLAQGGTSSVGNYIYGLGGSYLESAFLKAPAASDGYMLYHHQKSSNQIQLSGTRPNLSGNTRKKDLVLLYQIDDTTKGSEQPLCTLSLSKEVPNVREDFPLSFYPILCEDPSSSYHQVRSVNRLFHLLSPFNWEAEDIFNPSAPPQTPPPILKFSKQACSFILSHSPFHGFTLTNVRILLPLIDTTSARNVGLPSKISFYGSNCQDRCLFTKENILKATDSSNSNQQAQITKALNWFHIHSIEINSNAKEQHSIALNINIPIATPARFLIIHVTPAKEGREIGLCKMTFRGHQFYMKSLPHIEHQGPIITQTIESSVSKSKSSGRKGLRRSQHAHAKTSTVDSDNEAAPSGWASGSVKARRDLKRLAWSPTHNSRIVIDATGHTLRTRDEGTTFDDIIPFSCQTTGPISYQPPPMLRTKKIPLNRNLASTDLKHSCGSNLSLVNLHAGTEGYKGQQCVIWISNTHATNETRTLCQLSKNQNHRLELMKVRSVAEAIGWLVSKEAKDEQAGESEISTLNSLITDNAIRIVVTKECNSALCLEDALEESNDSWAQIPILIFDEKKNPKEPVTLRQQMMKFVFSSNCARTSVEFACFILRSTDLVEIPVARNNSSFLNNSRRLSLPTVQRTKKKTRDIPSLLSNSETSPQGIFRYFEVTIMQFSENSCLSVGLAPNEFPEHGVRLGTSLKSFGYQSDGTLWVGWADKPCQFNNSASPSFGKSDIIGCGFDIHGKQIFWTKNSIYLGPAARGHSKLIDLDTDLFPSVTTIGTCSLRANFGKTPFAFDLSKLESYTHPKLSNPNKKEFTSAIHPYSVDLFATPLINHNMPLLILAVLAQFSRTLNLLTRIHLEHWQDNQTGNYSANMQLLDAPALYKRIPIKRNSYASIDLTNTEGRANDLHVCSLWSLMPEKRASTLDISGWDTLSDSIFGKMLHPENIQTLNLEDCSFKEGTGPLIAERLVNLYSIKLWRGIGDQGIAAICSMPSLRKIDFSNSIYLTDSLLVSTFKKGFSSRESLESLNFTNCSLLSDIGLSQFASKCAGSIRGLKSLNLNFCNKITTTSISKILNVCKQLQHIHLATNPSQHGMTDQLVSHIAEEYNQKLQTLVLIRSTNITETSMNVVAARCHNLTHLDLAHCSNISDNALRALAESGSNLIKLDLFNTSVTDATAMSFVSNHLHLRYISLSRCNGLTTKGLISCFKHMSAVEFLSLRENNMRDEVLQALATTNFPSLVLIDISSCSQISQEVVRQLIAQLPHVLINTSHEHSKKYQLP